MLQAQETPRSFFVTDVLAKRCYDFPPRSTVQARGQVKLIDGMIEDIERQLADPLKRQEEPPQAYQRWQHASLKAGMFLRRERTEIENWIAERESNADNELLIQALNMLDFFTEGEVLDEFDLDFMRALRLRVNLTK